MDSETIWRQNLAALQRYHPAVHRLVSGDTVMAGAPVFAPDADSHIQAVREGFRGLLVFVGMGSGVEPRDVLRARPATRMLVVVEPVVEVFIAAMRTVGLWDFFSDRRVRLFVGPLDEQAFEETVVRIAGQEDIHVRRHVPSFAARPEYSEVDRRVFLILNDCNTAGGTTRRNGEDFFRNRLVNLSLVRHSRPIEALKGAFAGKPAVLAAAGPSLDRDKDVLASLAGRAVIFAVDSALVPMVRAGLVPDFVTTIDYQAPNFEKIAPLVDCRWSFSLIASPRVTPLIPARLRCRHLFWTFDDDLPQRWISDVLGVRELMPPGSSVAHLSLVSAMLMGCDPIVLVGQDLAYTNPSWDHAEDTVIKAAKAPDNREIFQVPGVGGTTVATDRLFMQIQKEFEEVIAASRHRVINASATGVRIAGTVEMPLAEAVERYMGEGVSVEEVMARISGGAAGFAVEKMAARARRISASCGRMLGCVEKGLRIGGKVRERVAALLAKGARVDGFEGLPGAVAGLLNDFDRLNRQLDNMDEPSEQIMELTFAALRENDRRREENLRLREEQGYLPWLLAEIERVEAVNRAREAACRLCRDLLDDLCGFLEREAASAADPDGKDAALARCYVERGLYGLAAPLFDSLAPGRLDGDLMALAGKTRAAMLDFIEAETLWGKSAAREEAAAARRGERAFWTEIAVRHVRFDGEIGDFPSLLPVWLERVARLTVAGEEADAGLRVLWLRSCLYCRSLMRRGCFSEAENFLAPWRPLSAILPAVDVLAAEIGLRRESAAADVPEPEPDDPALNAALAMYAIAADDAGRGIELLLRAVAVEPGWGALWEEIGDILSDSGDYEAAVAAYERCFTLLPETNSCLKKIGDCYLAMDKAEAARAAYEAALSRDPEMSSARAALAALS